MAAAFGANQEDAIAGVLKRLDDLGYEFVSQEGFSGGTVLIRFRRPKGQNVGKAYILPDGSVDVGGRFVRPGEYGVEVED